MWRCSRKSQTAHRRPWQRDQLKPTKTSMRLPALSSSLSTAPGPNHTLTHIPIPQQLGSGCTLRRSTRRSDHQVTRTAHPHWTETRLDETMSEGNPDALPGLVAKPPTGPWERRCRSQSRSHPSTISAPSKRHQARMPGNVCGFARVNLGSFRRPRRSELNYALPNAVNDADHGRPAQCPRTTTPSQTQGNSPPSESGPDRDP